MLQNAMDLLNEVFFGPVLTCAVFVCGLYFAVRLRPLGLLRRSGAVRTAKRRAASRVPPCAVQEVPRHEKQRGKMSPARAMLVALAGTLGVGNIAGVASAIAVGGAGAVFWMLVSAAAAMPVKYAEVVLSVGHRRFGSDGRPHGGAFFCIEDAGSRPAAAVFALLCLAASLTLGSAVQSNAAAVVLTRSFGLPGAAVGILFGTAVFLSVLGGLDEIAALTAKLVPFVSIFYLAVTLAVLVSHPAGTAHAVSRIFAEALSPGAFTGGTLGFFTSKAVRLGVTRGIVSNEAGCGTAPIAHAGADTSSPAAQGLWGMFEVFADTVVICPLTALAVLIADGEGVPPSPDGMTAASDALGHFLPHSDLLLAVPVTLFAFCTMLCWYHYGRESLSYLTGSRKAGVIYLIIYASAAALGAFSSEGILWSFADLTIGAMTAINLTALLYCRREIAAETERALKKR